MADSCLLKKIKSGDLDPAHDSLLGADLSYANLGGADLSGADLSYADLSYADLRGAYLGGADLRSADLSYADLRSAYLRGAYLGGAYLGGAYLSGANLGGADMPETFIDLGHRSDGWFHHAFAINREIWIRAGCHYFDEVHAEHHWQSHCRSPDCPLCFESLAKLEAARKIFEFRKVVDRKKT